MFMYCEFTDLGGPEMKVNWWLGGKKQIHTFSQGLDIMTSEAPSNLGGVYGILKFHFIKKKSFYRKIMKNIINRIYFSLLTTRLHFIRFWILREYKMFF